MERWISCQNSVSKTYNIHIDAGQITRSFTRMTARGLIDFGLLDEALQKPVVSRVLNSRKDRKKLKRLNPFLETIGDLCGKDGLIESNKKSVLCAYDQKRYRDRLIGIYERVANEPVRHRMDKEILLSRFLDLEHFCLLKWSDYGS